MKNLSFVFLFVSAMACVDSANKVEEKTKIIGNSSNVSKQNLDSIKVEDVAPWADSLIMLYIKKHDFKMTKTDTFPLTYIKEEAEWNGEIFIATRIGQSLEDHFATSQWIYIKQSDKRIFEYDVVNDSLILWNYK